MALKWLLWDDDDLAGFIRRELHSKNTFEKIVIELEREMRILNTNPLDDIRVLVEQMVTEHLGGVHNRFIQVNKPEVDKELQDKIAKDIENRLRQDIHEEISRFQVEFANKWNNRLKAIEDQKLAYSSKPQAQPDVLNIDLSPLEASINQLQGNIGQIQSGIGQLHSEQQKLDLRLRNVEVRGNTPPLPIVPPPDNNGALTAKIESQGREIENLKNNFILQSKNLTELKAAFDSLLKENATLKQQVAQHEQRIAALENQNRNIAQTLTLLQQNAPKPSEKPAPSRVTPRAAKPEPMQEPATPPIVTQSEPKKLDEEILPQTKPQILHWINYFSLSKPAMPFAYFQGDGEYVKTKLAESIQDMDGLITYLRQSEIEEPARTSFIKNLKWCMEALEKFYSKFKFDGCDPDELSEKITDKFFKILSDNLLDNVLVAIYRGGKKAIGYNDFLQKINGYLSKHGIYTQEIMPGMEIKGEILSSIEPPIPKGTTVAADDGKVDEVELLPYFMYYEDDDGNLETVRKRGRIVLLKYGA